MGIHHEFTVGKMGRDRWELEICATKAVTDLNSIRRIFMDFDSDGSGLIEPPAAWRSHERTREEVKGSERT